MKKFLALIFCLIGWFALSAQYYLMIQTSVAPFLEINIRFFSYFTILTNLIVAVYFTSQVFKKNQKSENSGTLTAVTIYIVIVGLIYQVVLRSTWNPTGLQRVVDELLHTLIPVFVLIYWFLYENKNGLNYKQIPKWAVYPLIYLFYILIRGNFSGFYPYPFVDVVSIGYSKVMMNSFWILVFFVGLSMLFIRTGKFLNK
ncbi:Pr6Pr family membrane protein [Chryseobacterium daeguense]|uniref:Pr6Pr family membrane protein n=1 Tax=Chryseobacterium daeguense TaxID=412438 RepID=UPI000425B964|nr:Pr6Pr family membrane protein [Chryseobacterium daeguense]